MIKEIVDIGRVSNRFASVFTFKGLPDFYVELLLEWKDGEFSLNNIYIKHLSEDKDFSKYGKELYLKYGVHRGKKSSMLYIFPSSFIFESREKLQEQIVNFLVTETKYKKILEQLKEENKINKKLSSKQVKQLIYPRIIEKIKNNQIKIYPKVTKYYRAILIYLDDIENKANETKLKIKENLKDRLEKKEIDILIKRVPIIVKIIKNNKKLFFYENRCLFKVFENIEFKNSAQTISSKKDIFCNIYPNLKASVYPSGGFYYPFSTDKLNVKYNLKDDKNLFLLSKEAYIDFLKGRTFLESYNNFYFMHLQCFVTATTLSDEVLKEFQLYAKESKSDLDSLILLIEKNFSHRKEILLNFYFYENAKTGGGKEIIEYVKDIIPSKLVRIVKLSDELKLFYKEKFNREKFQFNWQQHIYSVYYQEKHKKFRTALFRKIALGDYIDLDRLILIMNENMQSGIIRKNESDKNRYYYGTVIKHLMFLDWLDKLNKGELKMSNDEKSREFFKGVSYEERLDYFLKNANLVKDSLSMKIGVCVGLTLNILSWSINGYDKKILAFAGKRVERNNLSSLEALVNEIFAKTKFHGYERLHKVNIKFTVMQMLSLDDSSFNKDEFIFGLFLGSELYSNIKSEKDPEPIKKRGDEDENSTTGDEDE